MPGSSSLLDETLKLSAEFSVFLLFKKKYKVMILLVFFMGRVGVQGIFSVFGHTLFSSLLWPYLHTTLAVGYVKCKLIHTWNELELFKLGRSVVHFHWVNQFHNLRSYR